MPLVYADEDVAATVMGAGSWHGTYAEIMGVGAQEEYMRNHGMGLRLKRGRAIMTPGHSRIRSKRRQHRRGDFMYMPPTPQVGRLYEAGMGASLLEMVGLKSPLSKYKGKGMSDLEIFARFRAIHVQANQRIAAIPRGSAQETLRKQSASLEGLRNKLEPVFAPGAKAGEKDTKNLEQYVSGVLSLRSAVNAQVKVYGLRAVPDEEAITPAQAKAAAPADNTLLYLLGAGAALAFALL